MSVSFMKSSGAALLTPQQRPALPTAHRAARSAPSAPRRGSAAQRCVVAKAEAKPGFAKFADSIGMPTDEGYFGFKPFSEVWCGRWAMMGFVISIFEEAVTGRGTLGQLGVDSPSLPLTIGLSSAALLAVVIGSGVTAYKVSTRKLTPRDIARYKNFFGLNNPDDYKEAAAEMKRKGDFTSPGNNMAAVNAAKAAGTPADTVLNMDTAAAEAAAAEMKSGAVATADAPAAEAAPEQPAPVPTPRQRTIEEQLFYNEELRYARDIELSNGRAAMMGFLAAVLVEAATGKGIILQIIMYLKLSGLLGPMSGF